MNKLALCLSLPLIVILTVMAFPLLYSPVHAAILKLTSGQVIVGDIIEQDSDTVKIDTGIGVAITYFIDEIELIDGKTVNAIKENQPNPGEVTEITNPVSKVQSVKELEPINMIEDVRTDREQKDKLKSPIIPEPKIETKDNLSIVDHQQQAQETRSPFGPTIKEQKIESTKVNELINSGKSQTRRLLNRVYKETGLSTPDESAVESSGESSNAIIQNYHRFVNQQKSIYKQLINRLSDLVLVLQDKLYQVPIKVRQDMLVLGSCTLGIFYLLLCYPMMRMARTLGRKHSWLIWIPGVQLIYFIYIADKSLLWIFLLMIPVINLLAFLYLLGIILKELYKPGWMAFLILVPVINVLMLWIVAFSKPKARST